MNLPPPSPPPHRSDPAETPAAPAPEAPLEPSEQPGFVERRQSVVDRRYLPTGLERRRGPGRRRSEFMKSAEEGQMTGEQFLFVMAIDAYKRANQRPFPTWTEVLEVIRKLGYRKTCPMGLQLPNVDDWTEAGDAPAFPAPPPAPDDRASSEAA